jgi:amino acid adenylation domain-containing protein
VALLLEHDVSVIAAILGVLKADKIYVPLDPILPRVRLMKLLEDSQADLVVTNCKNLPLVHEIGRDRPHLINIDEIDSRPPEQNLGLSISPDTCAYVLYTSGSTGQPKGVVQNHRNVLHNISTYTNDIHICVDDHLTLLHSCGFVASVRNLFGALLNGAALFPFDIKEEGPVHLVGWLIQEGITIYHSASTLFRNVTETLSGEEEFPRLRLIQLSSEQVTIKDVEQYKKHFSGQCIFVNRLGGSETGTFRRYFIGESTLISGSTVPVGYAVEGAGVLLLDEDGKKAGFNEVGEIAVKSRYLALGYWRRPVLTKASFLPDSDGEDGCVYLTGDVGLMRPDGCLVYLGRKDFQAKIRGNRIEVTDVETALLHLGTIKEAVGVVWGDVADNKVLVAYIVPAKQPAPTVTVLRRALAEKLPDHMLPSVFVVLDALPLTPNGKVDRQALPDPGASRPELETPFVAPRTPVEKELTQIWAEVLSLDQVGIQDNFFDLGGHSLTATRIISQVIKQFKVDIPLQSLFQAPTVAEMAKIITERRNKKLEKGEINAILAELESLSDEEAGKLLADSSNPAREKP